MARSGKKRLVCIPTYLGTSLRNPPESPPSPVIRTPKKTTGKLQRQHQKFAAVQGTLPTFTYMYPGLQQPQKGPTTASTRNFFLPDQPTSQHLSFSNAYLIFDMHYAYYKVNTHTHIKSTIELYSDSTSSTPRTLSSATRESLRPQFYLLGMGCGISQQQQQQ